MKYGSMSIRQQSAYMKILLAFCRENRCASVPVNHSSLNRLRADPNFAFHLRVLHGLGYISVDWIQGLRPDSILVTAEGFAFFGKLAEEKRRFWRDSVILPIFLAFITTLIANVLSNGA